MGERTLTQAEQPQVDDAALLDEIDEIILQKLAEIEQSGSGPAQVKRWVSYYGKVYDLLYAKLLGAANDKPTNESFYEEVYEFLAESLWAKIEGIYDPDLNISEEQANMIIGKTRAKLKRVESALFGH